MGPKETAPDIVLLHAGTNDILYFEGNNVAWSSVQNLLACAHGTYVGQWRQVTTHYFPMQHSRPTKVGLASMRRYPEIHQTRHLQESGAPCRGSYVTTVGWLDLRSCLCVAPWLVEYCTSEKKKNEYEQKKKKMPLTMSCVHKEYLEKLIQFLKVAKFKIDFG